MLQGQYFPSYNTKLGRSVIAYYLRNIRKGEGARKYVNALANRHTKQLRYMDHMIKDLVSIASES